jgi:hypothetical protein
MTLENRIRPPRRHRADERTADAAALFTEDDFYALRGALERMTEGELAAFRSHPANQPLLRQYDRFAIRLALPYGAALVLLWLVSLVAAGSLSAWPVLPF